MRGTAAGEAVLKLWVVGLKQLFTMGNRVHHRDKNDSSLHPLATGRNVRGHIGMVFEALVYTAEVWENLVCCV